MKKIIHIATSLVLFAALFTATSCQKEDDDKVVSIEQQYLTAKIW